MYRFPLLLVLIGLWPLLLAVHARSIADPSYDMVSPQRAMTQSGWTLGSKRVLVIRIEYADRVGGSVTVEKAQAVLAEVATFFTNASYGQCTISAEVSPVYRLPKPAAYYATTLTDDWDKDTMAAVSADYTISDYDRLVIASNASLADIPSTRLNYTALGTVESERLWILGSAYFSADIVIHELGHTFGLLHANLWSVTDGNPLSAGGTSVEYGDLFDVMGFGYAPACDFSPPEKAELGWLPSTAVTTVTRSGTFRIYRFDDGAARLTHPLALHILRDGAEWVWVGYRAAARGDGSSSNGVFVYLAETGQAKTQLIDCTTPGVDGYDAALQLGSTLSDPLSGITIRPVGKGGSGTEQYFDVEVTIPQRSGIITAWGALFMVSTHIPPSLDHVTSMAAGYNHVVALKSDGTVVCWGVDPDHGQPVVAPDGLTDVVAVAAHYGTSGAIKRDGTIVMWGDNRYGNRDVPPGLADVIQLSIGDSHALALKRDGTVVGWGGSAPQGLNEIRNAKYVVAGTHMSLVVLADGTAKFFGDFSSWPVDWYKPVPSDLTNIVEGASDNCCFLAVRRDGTVIGWGDNRAGQATPPSRLSGVKSVSVGAGGTSYALKFDGTVVAWGASTSRLDRPPLGLTGVKQISIGNGVFALLSTAEALAVAAPEERTVALGEGATFSAAVAGSGPWTLQWERRRAATDAWEPLENDGSFSGVNTSTLVVSRATTGMSGDAFRLVVSSGTSTATSAPATLNVNFSRLGNISARAFVPVSGVLTVGYAVGLGGETKSLMMRGVGPTLAGLGVSDTLADPRLALFVSGNTTPIGANDNWASNDAMRRSFAALGAFALLDGSRDAAIQSSLACGRNYTLQLTSSTYGTSGIGLIEVYDADADQAYSRLMNISSLGDVGTNDNVLVAGFTIRGKVSKKVLIRAAGPSLAQFGVTGVLADPQLAIIALGQSAALASNDNWGGTSVLRAAFTSVGAFSLADGSADAAILVSLAPGSYTVVVSGVGRTSGNALVEVYDADP